MRVVDPRGLLGIMLQGGRIAEAGGVSGGSIQKSSGAGLFIGPAGFSAGGFTSSGELAGEGSSNQFVEGATAGLGSGVTLTNAKCAKDLLGPFDTWTINIPILSVQWATDGNIWTFGGAVGKSCGFSISRYPVTTTTASGCDCR